MHIFLLKEPSVVGNVLNQACAVPAASDCPVCAHLLSDVASNTMNKSLGVTKNNASINPGDTRRQMFHLL